MVIHIFNNLPQNPKISVNKEHIPTIHKINYVRLFMKSIKLLK